ncbi:carboxypeptidase-like regulatory domain-containing protein [Aquimarina sp. ERC-38]|uniref:carboxypeptidase-like regulatory domain-containing protein n=1 Tax=Aquimarina sp. ERC-38 TaxID=2949996 RepID=UPI002244FCBA|nr:carboxypeptidase-like regulatory domain-containing protein [Aquimarina sp. ERC-38]UZO81997.1 carboxypeptidase-like regulatory domain-containing protein [Aquimarina sp. ERC-38]
MSDAITKKPIPFATVKILENKGVITNEEGRFSFQIDESYKVVDSIYISSIGYESKAIALHVPMDSILYLQPAAIELESAFISNKNLTVDEIIDKVKENLAQNYDRNLTDKKLFVRQSDFDEIDHLKLTKYKSTIDAFSRKLVDSVIGLVPRKSQYYQEALCTYTSDFLRKKLYIEKGVELYNKENQLSMEGVSEKIKKIINENTKPDSYFKLKSGWLPGFKLELDSIRDEDHSDTKDKLQDSVPKASYFVRSQKNALKDVYSELFFVAGTKINVIEKSNRYDFTIKEVSLLDDQVVYVITFEPKRNEDFKGILYISTEDFAVVRIEYENVQRLKNVHLLGIHYQELLYTGLSIFQKNENGKYALKYHEKKEGIRVNVDRPFKIKELNKKVKGRNKQNELSFNLDIGTSNVMKYEVIVFNESEVTENAFESITENLTFKPVYHAQYNPDFWKDDAILEPNQAIRNFTSITSE